MRFAANLRFAVRTLAKSPSFALIAIVSLALGIGANTAMFSYVDAVLLRPLPVPDSGRIVEVDSTAPDTRLGSMSYPDYLDLRDHSKTLQALACYEFFFAGIATHLNQVPKYSLNAAVSGNFFSGLGIRPVLGRGFRADEDAVADRDLVAVISFPMWDRDFARDPAVLGRSIRVNGSEFTVVGVAPQYFTGPQAFLNPDIYIPMHAYQQAVPGAKPDHFTSRKTRGATLLGRLKPGVSAAEVQAELRTLARGLAAQYPETNRDRTVTVLGYVRARFENDPTDATLSLTLLGITGLVLLIACANVANLLLGRGTARAREIAIRMAIGASRAALVRQLLTESLLLAAAGGLAGIGVGYLGVQFLRAIPIPSDFPISLGIQMDTRLLVFSVMVSLATGVAFGLIPALRATRGDLALTIKASDSGPARISILRGLVSGRNVLVTAQLALSVVLLVISGDCIRGFQAAWRIDPGFRMDHTLFFSLDTSIQRYDEAKTRDFYRKLTDRLRESAGVNAVSMSSSIPFSTGQTTRKYLAEGAQPRTSGDAPSATSYKVDNHFFPLMQTKILRGRNFDSGDTAKSPRVAIINELLARKLFGKSDPIGRRFRLDSADGPELQVIGVAKQGLYFYWAEPATEAVWTPYSQDYSSQMYVEMRTAADPAAFAAVVRQQVRALDPDMPIFRISTMATFFHDRAMLGPRLIAQIVTATGVMGLFMAVIGLYGVVAYAVSRRTREIGIRVAVGATPARITRMVLNQGAIFTAVGLAIGLAMVIPIARHIVPNFVIGADPLGAVVLLGVPTLLAAATMAACWIPAQRAAKVDPTRALRQE
ncbi:MAG TPA: ABC transporter permease [Bryobacteraceae bacterium]|nr:ABC transporter permease [Bryobacteraceae bacterium]